MDYTKLKEYSETEQIDILIKLEEELIYEAAPYILELFESCSGFNKMCAAASLGKLGIKEPDIYGAKLLPFISSKYEALKQEVIEALGLLGYESAVKPLIELLKVELEELLKDLDEDLKELINTRLYEQY